ncbi:helix-turn-helix domain-containing protein [Streptosporangium vulgare]|uniref:winged helix-turn-helix transcriptional regulator n=1 Tax=Streptosporangium vulgare TaxID=46190 RepID=UPI0031CEEA63
MEIAAQAAESESSCDELRSILSRAGEKRVPPVMAELVSGPRRFNQLRRLPAPITQRMPTATLRGLECDGLITRTVHPTVPPQVEYDLTDAGRELPDIKPGRALDRQAPRGHPQRPGGMPWPMSRHFFTD